MAATDAGANRVSPIAVQLHYVEGCPFVDDVRELVQRVLAGQGAAASLEEIEGPFPSPTVLVDGLDVTGREVIAAPSCRLDLPTEVQVSGALDAARARRDERAARKHVEVTDGKVSDS
jgi:hypothetical protein